MNPGETIFSLALLATFVAFAVSRLRDRSTLNDVDRNPHAMSDRWRGERELGQMRRSR